MSSDGLKSCPFCGGAARIGCEDEADRMVFVECTHCFCQTDENEEAEAIAAWNTRTNPDGLREALEEARHCIATGEYGYDDEVALLAKIDAALASLPHGGEE